ncbi:MAG: Nif11-like leader peptide family RiPP precursor [Burkholderiales bacterium]
MTYDTVRAFLEQTNRDAKLAAAVTVAISNGLAEEIVDIAADAGYKFSPEEGLAAWKELEAAGELPDVVLDAVAGGSRNPNGCSTQDCYMNTP